MLKENTIAPDFKLLNAQSEQKSLSNYIGHWVLLYFYPKDDTPGCTKEACAFRDNFPFYEDTRVQVIGISKDTPESHAKFKEKYDLPFELLSDIDGAVSELYGSGFGENPKRISYLIAPNGSISKAYSKVNPATHADEVITDLKILKQ